MKSKHLFSKTGCSLLLAAEGIFLKDILFRQFGLSNPSVTPPSLTMAYEFILFFVIGFVLTRWFRKAICFSSLGILSVFLLFIGWVAAFACQAPYTALPQDKESVFANQKVLLIVPHEDDDVNIFGGIMEQYADYGSDISVVFTTNGDYYELGNVRIAEAIKCAKYCGIPEDHVYFLGYGDSLISPNNKHIYNADPNTVFTSRAGKEETYGITSQKPYHLSTYTSSQYLSDIEQFILEHKPDMIYCVDYDPHPDHKAISLYFEKAMGHILKTTPDYRPQILKAYAYSTAWLAVNDFWQPNLPSTVLPPDGKLSQVSPYIWDNRERLPVRSSGLSRSILTTDVFREFLIYGSQRAIWHAAQVCNADRVFWFRSTDSIAYDASITASSGNGELVNDFMLFDSSDIISEELDTSSGIWIPAENDAEKSITVQFSQAAAVHAIYLYDNPSPKHNILNADILLDDGTLIPTGPLNSNGSATIVPLPDTVIHSLTIKIRQSEGENAGISELEVYKSVPVPPFSYVKIMDESGNFVYDYQAGAISHFALYSSGEAPLLSSANYIVSVDNPSCSAEIDADGICVTCPRGNRCHVTIQSRDGIFSDTIVVQNRFTFTKLNQFADHIFEKFFIQNQLVYLFVDLRNTILSNVIS